MSAPTARAAGGAEPAAKSNGNAATVLREQSPAAGTLRAVQQNTVAPERVSGAQSVVRSLEELGVEVVFGIPGGAVLPVYDLSLIHI